MIGKRPQLGRILLRAGLISDQELARAIQYREQQRCRLGEALIALGLCSQVHVARALAEQMEMPFVDLEEMPPSPRAMRMIPRHLAEQYGAVPVSVEGDTLLVAARNPLDFRLDDVLRQATGKSITVACGMEQQIVEWLRNYDQLTAWDKTRQGGGRPAGRGGDTRAPAPARSAPGDLRDRLQGLVVDAVRKGATEIDFHPQLDSVHIRARIDGSMLRLATYPPDAVRPLMAEVRRMCGMALKAEAGSAVGGYTLEVDGALVALRATAMPGVAGEAILLRTRRAEARPLAFGQLEIVPQIQQALADLLSRGRGLVLVAGPAGSGVTTALYSLLGHLPSDSVRSAALEEEVECRVPGVVHWELGPQPGARRLEALQSVVDQRYDAVMLDCLPDGETARLACEAASRMLVLAGMTAAGSVAAMRGLLDLAPTPTAAAAVFGGVLSQRLVRRVCEACAEKSEPPEDAPAGGRYRAGAGCERCFYRGVRGRVAVHELVTADDDLRYLLARNVLPSLIERFLRKRGVRSMLQDAADKAARGMIPFDEVRSVGSG